MNTWLFADDTALAKSAKTYKELKQQCNFEIQKVQDWLLANNLSVHYAKKTQYILFIPPSRSKEKYQNFSLSMGGHVIEQTASYKYLGILIDEKLNWIPQVDAICSKLSSVCGILSKARHYLDRNALMLIYNSLVESRLRYGILSWGTASKTQINRIKVLQNRALRFISFSPIDLPMLPLYSRFNILPFQDILHLQQATFMYSFYNDKLPHNFKPYFTTPSHNHNTRYSHSNFSLPPISYKVSDRSIKVIGPRIWANVLPELKSLPFRKTFSKQFKKHLLSGLPCPKPYKPKFRRKGKNVSMLSIFDDDDDDEDTFNGFELSLSVIFGANDIETTFHGLELL